MYISSEDLETTHNTKQRFQQQRSCHTKLNIEGWDAQERREHMKLWKIVGSDKMSTYRSKYRTGSTANK